MDTSNSSTPYHNPSSESPPAEYPEIQSVPAVSQCAGAETPDTVCLTTLARSPDASMEKSDAPGAFDWLITADLKLLDPDAVDSMFLDIDAVNLSFLDTDTGKPIVQVRPQLREPAKKMIKEAITAT